MAKQFEFKSLAFTFTPMSQVQDRSKLKRKFEGLSFYPELLKSIRRMKLGKEVN